MKSWQTKVLAFVGLASAIALESIGLNTLAQSTNLQTFQQQALAEHNALRQKHGASPLALDAGLNKLAQDWAQHMATTGQFDHRPNNRYGENLYAASSSQPGYDIDGKEAVDDWYNEIKFYNYEQPGFSIKTGHFTQLVWKSSRRLGCGKAKGRDGTVYVACNYDPPGNVQGQFPQNVR